ncbi:MAG: aldose epimerase family protein [Pseudomonadota bacterium]
MNTSIRQAPFGRLADGADVSLFTLTNANGLVAKVTDFGGIITELHTRDRNGALADIVLGFDRLAPYLGEHPYFGALIGRYANRIAGGRFMLDGTACQLDVNDGANHLHGGRGGLHTVLWDARADGAVLTLRRRCSDGEQGYPGTLDITATYQLSDDDELIMRLAAVTDRATPVNLTQHSYFNLAGRGDILGHELTLHADRYTPVSEMLIPTGEIAPVAGTPFDFRTARPIGERIGEADRQLRYAGGYDHNFVLNRPGLAARVRDPASGRVMELFTDQPGVQFYSGNFLDGTLGGKGRQYTFRSGLCLEPQHFPDSPNQPSFPDTVLRPGEQYATESRYRFGVD